MIDKTIFFYKGNINCIGADDKAIESIKKDISKVLSSSNLSFLLGAGCSANSIPTMRAMWDNNSDDVLNNVSKEIKQYANEQGNFEKLLEVLIAQKFYLERTNQYTENIQDSITQIKEIIFKSCNVSMETDNFDISIETYKSFYKKIMYRENSLSKVNIFTTNYDLLNEMAMDDLGIIYCNGFSGNINRYFNPMTFNYAYAESIGLSDKKYHALDKYVYLYKLHGSINWVEDIDTEKMFQIKEIQNPDKSQETIMIYPTPTKQNSSFSSPYSDLFREFHKKVLIQDNALVVIGYSFADEHINNIIYQALATIPKFRLIIFAYGDIGENSEIQKIINLDDPRIWVINGKINNENDSEKNQDISDFSYIVKTFLVETNEDDDLISKSLDDAKKLIKKHHDTR
jgi:NAD-dependent SIR2 family protein deacetylase